ncbi:uncharacterized protein LOC114336190 [Diabrotica virgifera virgifera]|uniref:Uncharacterized protein LOC114336190 n=1 Tax=Diabrotica virgifera virgifera TaxID=50390 RepID=A0A6P7G5M7_DIAVI|nr:uncharacterized protein LOC114336190 [Diabrotica virgifera virgifera]
MEVKQEPINFPEEECEVKIENLDVCDVEPSYSVKTEIKDELEPCSLNTDTESYFVEGNSVDSKTNEFYIEDVKLEEEDKPDIIPIENGRDEAYESKWFAYAAMQSLEDQDTPRQTMVTENENLHTEELRNGLAEELHSKKAAHRKKETSASSSSLRLRSDPSRSRATNNGGTSAAKKRLHKKNTSPAETMSSASSILKNAAENLNKGPSEQDEIGAFVKFLSAKVRKYSPAVRKGVQHAIMDVIMKADKGLLNCQPTLYPHHTSSTQSSIINSPNSENFVDYV